MELNDFAELAPLYALDALDQAEQSWVESHANQVPDWDVQLHQYREAAALLPYSVPLMPLPAELKQQLFRRIAAETSALVVASTVGEWVDRRIDEQLDKRVDERLTELIEQSQQVDWQPYAPAPGTWLGKLLVDAERREIHCFVRSWGEAAFPKHRHLGTEELIVLEGDLVIGDCHYQPGDRIASAAGSVHQPKTQTGCLLFLRTSLDDELLS